MSEVFHPLGLQDHSRLGLMEQAKVADYCHILYQQLHDGNTETSRVPVLREEYSDQTHLPLSQVLKDFPLIRVRRLHPTI